MVGITVGQTLVQVPQPSDLKNSPRFTVIDTRPPAKAKRTLVESLSGRQHLCVA
jgi:hypothetical protein